jgi:hypothetical protein
VRLFVQFGEQEPSANRDALRKGMAWLEGMLFQNQVREVIFDTEGPLLMALAKRRLGFTETAPGTLYKTLPSPATMRAVEGHWHHQPTTSEEAG